jgi:hypothetical protein
MMPRLKLREPSTTAPIWPEDKRYVSARKLPGESFCACLSRLLGHGKAKWRQDLARQRKSC